MQFPLVSIIIPTYNRAARIIQTLDSIIAQTYKNIELIVVNDGSSDNTLNVLKNYNEKAYQKKFKFKIITQKHAGAPAARNNGLKNASGEYIVFFDSDDIMISNRIEKQINCLIEEESDCCICGFYYNDENGKTYLPDIRYKKTIKNFLYRKIAGSTQAWMYKRELISKVNGYDERLFCSQDIDINFRIIIMNPRISILRIPLSIFVAHRDENRITNQHDTKKAVLSFILFYKKLFSFLIDQKEYQLYNYSVRKFYSVTIKSLALQQYKKMLYISTKHAVKRKNVSKIIIYYLFSVAIVDLCVRYVKNAIKIAFK